MPENVIRYNLPYLLAEVLKNGTTLKGISTRRITGNTAQRKAVPEQKQLKMAQALGNFMNIYVF